MEGNSKHSTYNIRIAESNSPVLTKRNPVFKNSPVSPYPIHDGNKNNSNKGRYPRLFRSLQCFVKQCRKNTKKLYSYFTQLKIPLLFILWLCYYLMQLPEYLLYLLIYSFFLTADFLYKLGFKVFAKAKLFVWRKERMQIKNQKEEKRQGELTIVLDIDETLVYTTDEAPSMLDYDYFSINDCVDGLFYVYKRPHLDHFLKKVSQLGRIVIFTASEKSYATQVIKNIGQNIAIAGAYFRDVSLL
eukprot:TRINITY_DN13289_c0_g1_i9.p1 TRINITY_DN13289_c0_g1~~TRINITY_DN13289_c0_g1_i9.p1  ORF type:complete len:244 (-),score=34.53 TRINITY_DN13289_c0_g1_i9:351-1082(-)